MWSSVEAVGDASVARSKRTSACGCPLNQKRNESPLSRRDSMRKTGTGRSMTCDLGSRVRAYRRLWRAEIRAFAFGARSCAQADSATHLSYCSGVQPR